MLPFRIELRDFRHKAALLKANIANEKLKREQIKREKEGAPQGGANQGSKDLEIVVNGLVRLGESSNERLAEAGTPGKQRR